MNAEPTRSRHVEAPCWCHRAGEARWPFEIAAHTVAHLPFGLAPKGDGHPVLLLPGFAAGDTSTLPLRRALRTRGHRVHGWRLGQNVGPTREIVDGMRARLDELHRADGRRVSMVGWSLGGVYARLLARERPEIVRQVVTLASPFQMVEGDRSTVQPLWDQLRRYHDGDLDLYGRPESERPPLTVPATSIYTRADGVVHWATCIDDTGPDAPNPRAENIEVYSTHIGIGINPSAIFAIADRLAQPEGDWQPFRPPLALRAMYPTPTSRPPGARRPAA